jgi:hypothetical protein
VRKFKKWFGRSVQLRFELICWLLAKMIQEPPASLIEGRLGDGPEGGAPKPVKVSHLLRASAPHLDRPRHTGECPCIMHTLVEFCDKLIDFIAARQAIAHGSIGNVFHR